MELSAIRLKSLLENRLDKKFELTDMETIWCCEINSDIFVTVRENGMIDITKTLYNENEVINNYSETHSMVKTKLQSICLDFEQLIEDLTGARWN